MGSFYDEMPDWLMTWLVKQHIFFVATSAREGHVNVSPKGMEDTFHIIDNKTVWYEDLSGSGVETISHLRENGRITIMFTAFDKPPRIARLFGTGTVYEYGTPEYEQYIPAEKRKPGSRSVILVDIHKVGSSCGYAVPFMEFKSHRNVLEQWAAHRERDENAGSGKGMREYWRTKNTQSIDGVPGLKYAHETEGELKSVGVPAYARIGGVGEDLSAAGKYSRSASAVADKLGLNAIVEKAEQHVVPLVQAVDTHYVLGLLSGAIAALAYVRFVDARAV